MKWPYPKEHQNKDINDVPTNYLEWVVETWDNVDAVQLAKDALEFRERKGVVVEDPKKSTRSSNGQQKNYTSTPSKQTSSDAEIRLKILELAVAVDQTNPWSYVEDFGIYVLTGTNPSDKDGQI